MATSVLQAICEVALRPTGMGLMYDRRKVFQDLFLHVFHCRLRDLPSCYETSWKYEDEDVFGINARSENASISTNCLFDSDDTVTLSASFMFMNRFEKSGACLEVEHEETIPILDLSGETLEAALDSLTEFVVTKLKECNGDSNDSSSDSEDGHDDSDGNDSDDSQTEKKED